MKSSPCIYFPISAGISEISGIDDTLPLKHFSLFFSSQTAGKKESKESVRVYLREDDMFFLFLSRSLQVRES